MRALLKVVLASLLAPAPAQGAAPPVKGEPAKGVIVGQAVVTCVADARRIVYAYAHPLGEDAFFRGVECSGAAWSPVRWHVGYGAFWVSADSRLQPEGLPIPIPESEPLLRYDLPSLLKGKLADQAGVPRREAAPPFAVNTAASLARLRGRDVDAEYEFEIHYDFLPVGSVGVFQFVLTDVPAQGPEKRPTPSIPDAEGAPEAPAKPKPWPWSFTAYRYEGRWDQARKKWRKRPWTKAEAIRVGFREPFQALGRGQDYYFVTRSGKLFRAPEAAGGKPRNLEAVWDDPKRPITAFLTDADTGRAFLFLPPAKGGGKPAFFELAAKAKPVEYDPGAVPLPPYDEPHRGLLHKARILWALKKVAVK
jgi:hypothetical protein